MISVPSVDAIQASQLVVGDVFLDCDTRFPITGDFWQLTSLASIGANANVVKVGTGEPNQIKFDSHPVFRFKAALGLS
jgi:hypothetical protein